MRNLLLFTAMSIALTTALTGCGKSRIDRLYNESLKVVAESERGDSTSTPELKNADDSISYLMGYVYGKSFASSIEKEEKRGKFTDRDMFETGVAMVLQADSTDLSLLKGIMMGITLRRALERLEDDINADWDSTLAFRGMYQGLNGTIADKLPTGVAEENLNRLLYRYFLPSDTTKRGKQQ